MKLGGLRIALVGPLPPPAGGMANQTRQLAALLTQEGAEVEVVRVNAPYRPEWIAHVRIVRALFRLLPYLAAVWRAAGRSELMHLMANSGWSWHLFATPAILIARLRGTPIIVNYRGGDAERFFAQSFFWVRPVLALADMVVVPSRFLQAVFAKRQIPVRVVPNIIDLARFSPRPNGGLDTGLPYPRILVARNLEPIYDNATALRAFAAVQADYPEAELVIAGTGGELDNLKQLAAELNVASRVIFTGQVNNAEMAVLYRQADVVLNPSTVDNMPISLLEAMASGVPIVSTDAGGIPFLIEHDRTGLLVKPGDYLAMAAAIRRLLIDPDKALAIRKEGLRFVDQFGWTSVRIQLLDVYQACRHAH